MTGLITRARKRKSQDRERIPGTVAVVEKPRLVVIGNGMVGHHFLEKLEELHLLRTYQITVFGEERTPALDRVNLTRVLTGSSAESLELRGRDWYRHHGITLHTDDPVREIDREARMVHSREGYSIPYDLLVMATGSEAIRPDIPGADEESVFVYRTLSDLVQIKARAGQCDRVAVIGGGLLGLEAAEALHRLGLETHLVERGSGLLSRQLNPEGAAVLQEGVEKAGIIVHNAKSTQTIRSEEGRLELSFSDHTRLTVGMVVLATGIRPRDELARNCGLEIGPRGGVEVDETLTSSDPRILAIGECASCAGQVYGLVLPGYEMASVLAARLGQKRSRFRSADQSAVLKMDVAKVSAVGEYQAAVPSYSYGDSGQYRRLFVRNGRLVGAIGVGEWPEQARVREAIKRNKRVWAWNISRFESKGEVWRTRGEVDVTQWSDRAEVCNCRGVSKGTIRQLCGEGGCSVEEISARTGASTVCGSCKPLVAQLAGAPMPVVGLTRMSVFLFTVSLVAVLATTAFLLLDIPFSPSVQGRWKWERVWTDSFLKQISGFTLVGLALLSMVLSLRKRLGWLQWGEFAHWRLLHSVLGVSTLMVLFVHTGLHLGHNLNLLLSLNFIGLAVFGALAGLVVALEHRIGGTMGRCLRQTWITLHIVFLWPLPSLVLFHALSSYVY